MYGSRTTMVDTNENGNENDPNTEVNNGAEILNASYSSESLPPAFDENIVTNRRRNQSFGGALIHLLRTMPRFMKGVVILAFLFVFVSVAAIVLYITTPSVRYTTLTSAEINELMGDWSMFPSTSPQPSDASSIEPSSSPFPTYSSERPSNIHSGIPSFFPSSIPSSTPTESTSFPSGYPSNFPTLQPSISHSPTTKNPTSFPSKTPTASPTASPTKAPTPSPTSFPTQSPTATYLDFAVTGDGPYEAEEAVKVARYLQEVEDSVQFVVHVGDLNRAKDTNCAKRVFEDVSKLLEYNSKKPLFITPGDNDWNDCPNPNLAWQYYTQYFYYFDKKTKHNIQVSYQPGRRENFSFYMKDFVLFIGLNIVGGNVHDSSEWRNRLTSESQWFKAQVQKYAMSGNLEAIVLFGHASPNSNHDRFFDPLADEANRLKIPILYMHGDGHKWEHESSALGSRYITRVQVDQFGRRRPVRVRITKGANPPWEFHR